VEGLTARQEQVLAFIRECLRDNGYPPTVREICGALQLSSPSTVHAHLAIL
jgi:repressor LexA